MLDNFKLYRKLRGGLWRKIGVPLFNYPDIWYRNTGLANTFEFIVKEEDYRYFDPSVDTLNGQIKGSSIDTNLISDGYHTFGELYEHRIALWIALCKAMALKDIHSMKVWRSKLHSDGTSFDGWFVLGIGTIEGTQMTYYLPMSKWDECNFAETLGIAPEFDGHTSQDVLNRIQKYL